MRRTRRVRGITGTRRLSGSRGGRRRGDQPRIRSCRRSQCGHPLGRGTRRERRTRGQRRSSGGCGGFRYDRRRARCGGPVRSWQRSHAAQRHQNKNCRQPGEQDAPVYCRGLPGTGTFRPSVQPLRQASKTHEHHRGSFHRPFNGKASRNDV